MISKFRITTTLLFLLRSITILSQQNALTYNPLIITQNIVDISRLLPQEKAYLHLDNTAYFLEETIWFKAYIINAISNTRSDISKILYVELVAPEGYIVETKKYKIENGVCHGEFELPKQLLSGYYEIRAYTRYMLNWGDEAVYSRVIPVYDRVVNGDYTFRNMLQRERSVFDKAKLIPHKHPPVNLQFYPESGHLVSGIMTNIAYELRGESGILVNDTIYFYQDKRLIGKTVPQHKGKGKFRITPIAGVKYRAEVSRKGKTYKFDLPKMHDSGTVINVNQRNDSVQINITHNLENTPQLYIALLNQKIADPQTIELLPRKRNRLIIPNTDISEGVNKVILFDKNGRSYAERMFFIKHKEKQPKDQSVNTIETSYKEKPIENSPIENPYEKVKLEVRCENYDASSSLSCAVYDSDHRIHTDYSGTIYTDLLLSSSIKGYISDVGYYFDKKNSNRHDDLDLLMLTNGWTAFGWAQLTCPDSLQQNHPIEKGLTIKGNCAKYYGKSAYVQEHTAEMKVSGKRSVENIPDLTLHMTYVADTMKYTYELTTDSLGNFTVPFPDFYGARNIKFTPQVKRDKKHPVQVTMDKYFSPRSKFYKYEEYNLLKKERPNPELPDGYTFDPYAQLLDDVVIKGKKRQPKHQKPPHSLIRHNYLEEYEYARDVYARYIDEFKSDDYYFPDYILRSIFYRYRYVWGSAYIINTLECDDDSIPELNKNLTFLDKNPFKEFVIRTDIPTRKRYHRLQVRRHWSSLKIYYSRIVHSENIETIYDGAHSDCWWWVFPTNWEHIDGYHGRLPERYAYPDYVACLTVYDEQDSMYSQMPDLITDNGTRYTRLKGYDESKEFYHPDYSSQPLPEIKDYRRTLYWNPDLKLDEYGKAIIEFYNNSTCKHIDADIQGIDNSGAIYLNKKE